MATLEDTFRMMKGDEPVNTEKLSEQDKNFQENKSLFNSSGAPGGKITKDFMDVVKNALVESR